MTRRSLTVTQLKPLFALCRNTCALHDIEPRCTGFSLVQDGRFIGEIAHIAAAEEGGKRYDPDMDDDQRNANDNLTILCRNHHALIDRDEAFYTTEFLLEAKRSHEAVSSGDFEPPEEAIQEAAVQVNIGITTNNVNAGSGNQNNTANTNTGQSTTINISGANGQYTFMVAPTASSLPPTISSSLPPATGPDQTLSLSIELRVVELPVAGQPGQVIDTFCYCFTFNDKYFVAEQGAITGLMALAARDRTGRRFSITGAGVAHLFRQAHIFAEGSFGETTLYDEIRHGAENASLGVIVEECADGNIMAIPFDRLTAADLGAANYVGFALRQGVEI